ncbi:MAG: indolepyruvate oxidoreductase subunit beta [Clostridia bacterium]|nr:indolepyruvate oxidoreductase subunit beta [Clostridia bacterium]
MRKFDAVIVGVGGQGILLTSKILGRVAMAEGSRVKVSEVHGMSQRGGSVITHVRVGEEAHAPLVTMGQADFLIGFEVLETARAALFVKPAGIVITSTQRILPMPVISGVEAYPQQPLALFSQRVESVDAPALARKAGSPKAVNLVLLGMLSRHLWFSVDAWKQAIAASVPKETYTVNMAAFQMGMNDV